MKNKYFCCAFLYSIIFRLFPLKTCTNVLHKCRKSGTMCLFTLLSFVRVYFFVFDCCRIEMLRARVSSKRHGLRSPPHCLSHAAATASLHHSAHVHMEASCWMISMCLDRQRYVRRIVSWEHKERKKHLPKCEEKRRERAKEWTIPQHPRCTVCPERMRCTAAEQALLFILLHALVQGSSSG